MTSLFRPPATQAPDQAAQPSQEEIDTLDSAPQSPLSARSDHSMRVALLDAHPALLLGLQVFLNQEAGFLVAHSDTSVDSLFNKLKDAPCDAVIIDFYLPSEPSDGVDLVRRLRRQHPHIAIIASSAGNALETEYAAFRAGANGYLPKTAQLPAVAQVVRAAVNAPKEFISYRSGNLKIAPPKRPDSSLTNAETEILRNISLGLSVTQVSERLLRSKKTVSTHKRRAMQKLGLTNDLALALYLKENFQKRDTAEITD